MVGPDIGRACKPKHPVPLYRERAWYAQPISQDLDHSPELEWEKRYARVPRLSGKNRLSLFSNDRHRQWIDRWLSLCFPKRLSRDASSRKWSQSGFCRRE